MQPSARRGISYPNPDRSDRPDIPAHFGNIIAALEVDVVYVQGTDAQRLAAAHMAGVLWRTTDTGAFWWDTGVVWINMAPGVTFNTYANRPNANTVPVGQRYYATDTGGLFYGDGATWTLIAQDELRVSLAAFALAPWTTPYDGMKVALTIDATNGIYWTFKYNAGSGSAYKWEFLGGPELYSEITTSETVTGAAYAALATAGPSIALPRPGDYGVDIGALISNNTATDGGMMSYDIGGAAAVDADAIQAISATGGATSTAMRRRLKTGLTAATLVAKYRTGPPAGGTASFAARWMSAKPTRIS